MTSGSSTRGEYAQIDHLVVHPFRLVNIESKSIHGEVKVNGHGEWSRSYRGQWYGMPTGVGSDRANVLF